VARRPHRALGDVGSDISGFFSNVVGGFATAEQAQGSMTQAQTDAANAIAQQQSSMTMTLILVGLGAFLLLRK
jgi:hypothetical protein